MVSSAAVVVNHVSEPLDGMAVFDRFRLLDTTGNFHRPVDTFLGINDAVQRDYPACRDHVDLEHFKQRVTQNIPRDLGCDSCIIQVFYCFFGFVADRFLSVLNFSPTFATV